MSNLLLEFLRSMSLRGGDSTITNTFMGGDKLEYASEIRIERF
jgi:hypothetical protein